MITLEIVKERLHNYAGLSDLEDEDKSKILSLLKEVSDYRDLKKGRRRPYPSRQLRTNVRISNPTLYGYKSWLQTRGYLLEQKGWEITEKGREGILILDAFLNPPERDYVTLKLNLEKEYDIKVSARSDNMEPLDNVRMLMTEDNLDSVKKLVYGTLDSVHASSNLTVDLTIPSHPWSALRELLFLMVDYFSYLTEETSLPAAIHRRYGYGVRNEWSKQRLYSEYWKLYSRKLIQLYKGRRHIELMKYIEKEVSAPDLFRRIIELGKKNKPIRKWIGRILSDDPNYFMPYIFWFLLGYKGKGDPTRLDNIRIPSYSDIISVGLFEKKLMFLVETLDSLYSMVGVKQQPRVLDVYRIFRDPDYYECWKIIRKDYQGKLPEVSSVLNSALERYIRARKPHVDVVKALKGIYHEGRPASDVISAIRKGEYKLRPKKKRMSRR